MRADTSVTQWIDRLKGRRPGRGPEDLERYFRRLVGLARKKLRAAPRRAADEEDVALSAFDSFCRGAEQGRFPNWTTAWTCGNSSSCSPRARRLTWRSTSAGRSGRRRCARRGRASVPATRPPGSRLGTD